MTQSQHNRKKLSQIMSLPAYDRANEWYKSLQNVPEHAKGSVDGIFRNTGHREYLSRWLEAFIIKYMRKEFPNYKTHKVDNRGAVIHNRVIGGARDGEVTGIMGYRKDHNQIEGEPDIRCLRPNMQPLYFEIKVKKDKLSDVQKDFINAGFGEVILIKTVDEFWVWRDGYSGKS
jgi:hypothetical protein